MSMATTQENVPKITLHWQVEIVKFTGNIANLSRLEVSRSHRVSTPLRCDRHMKANFRSRFYGCLRNSVCHMS
jgi:hypothetical protein